MKAQCNRSETAGARRVVLAGLGSIGRRHARLLRERAGIVLEVVEPDPTALAAAEQALGPLRSHPDFAAALATAPDVVWIATPTALHAAQAIAALEAGAHVFCEKPMSGSVESALRMRQAADRARTVFNVGFYLHFWYGMERMKQFLQAGAAGRVLHAHARVGSYATLVNSASRYQAVQPGSLFFDYAHQPDLFYWLLGRAPDTVWAAGFQGGGMELGSSPNVADMVCEYSGGLIATVHLNYVQLPERHAYEITGDRGWIEADFFGGWIRYGSRDRATAETESFVQQRDDIFRAEHDAFFAAVDGLRAPETSAADGLVSTAVCEAAVQSWQSGERVAPARLVAAAGPAS